MEDHCLRVFSLEVLRLGRAYVQRDSFKCLNVILLVFITLLTSDE